MQAEGEEQHERLSLVRLLAISYTLMSPSPPVTLTQGRAHKVAAVTAVGTVQWVHSPALGSVLRVCTLTSP